MMTGWNQIILEPVKTMLNKVGGFVPVLFGALVILLAGWIIAKIVSGLVQKALEGIKFNDFSAKIGLTDLLSKGNVPLSPTALLVSAVYWAGMIVVFATTVDAIGLNVAATLLVKVSSYIPNVISAVFVLIVGMFLANLISGVIKAAAADAGLARAELLGSVAKGAILVFTTVVVLEELNIASFFVTTTFQIFFAAICLALALSFGLGGKDLAAKILWDFFNKQNINK
ncbi:MAG: hypothetical protein HQL22_05285 [Candidatus Omnitrophica bacterium]|nr:hypothetical protein [Candidatus Omnitrophota bacterium]